MEQGGVSVDGEAVKDIKTVYTKEQLSGDGKVDFASVNRELVQVQRSLEQGMADWETAASELEEIRLENERIHQELN